MHVFPGGVVESADYSNAWMELLHRMSERCRQRDWKNLQISGQKLDAKVDPPIPNEIAFRISAIRETFEESGVLAVRSFNSKTPDASTCCGSMQIQDVLSQDEVKSWSEAVIKNPSSFIDLCRYIGLSVSISVLLEKSE